MIKHINFEIFDGPLYSTRSRGKAARVKINLDKLESDGTKRFKIIIPPNFFTMTSSFFLGLFTKSIQDCGSKEDFFNKFDFSDMPAELKPQIDEWAGRALNNKTTPYTSE